MANETVQGFLNLNKPFGFTSHDCVAKVRRLLNLKRVGHAGTLDPAAIGVLPIAIGKATRLLQYLPSDKAYQATIRFGIRTATDDLQGEILSQQAAPDLELQTVTAALPQFQGVLQQVPPNYSAIQVQGKRLYNLARAGATIAVPARSVTVYHLEVLDWRSGEYPELDLTIACGAGTYIRAIARDLGEVLNVGGTLAALTRTRSSGFDLTESLSLDRLEQPGTVPLVSPERALQHLDAIVLSADRAKRWCQGQKIGLPDLERSGLLRVQDEGDRFLGIGQFATTEAGMVLVPQMVYAPDSDRL